MKGVNVGAGDEMYFISSIMTGIVRLRPAAVCTRYMAIIAIQITRTRLKEISDKMKDMKRNKEERSKNSNEEERAWKNGVLEEDMTSSPRSQHRS